MLPLQFGLLTAAFLFTASAPSSSTPTTASIMTGDVDRFYQVYDQAGGHPDAEHLQNDYIDQGTPAFRQFAIDRKITGASVADAIAKKPVAYERARACAHVLPAVRSDLLSAFARLRAIYPASTFPPVTMVIGRNATFGTTNASGVVMGMEGICSADFMDPNLTARFVHLIAHEYAHIQQPAAQTDPVSPTVLFASLMEGGAELVAEEISGDVGNYQLKAWTKGHEQEIEERFSAERESTDLSHWLWNHGPGTPDHPADLGYWVGYRITKAYLLHARDRCAALRTILTLRDPHDVFAQSGWSPGMTLPMGPVPMPRRCPVTKATAT